jgi:hypothetical protein
LLFTLLGCLAVFIPFGIHCLIVARLNSRRHPVLVWGVWDFALVLLGVSGVLLYAGPGFLTGFTAPWRDVWLDINYGSLRAVRNPGPLIDPRPWIWTGLWYLYFALIACGSAAALWRRRRLTAVYNSDPATLFNCLGQVLDRLGYAWERAGSQIRIHSHSVNVGNGQATVPRAVLAGVAGEVGRRESRFPMPVANSAPSTFIAPPTVLEINSFPAMRHLTLLWRSEDEALRQAVESELKESLAEVWIGPSPVARWLRAFALGLFVVLFLLTAYVQILRVNAEGLW